MKKNVYGALLMPLLMEAPIHATSVNTSLTASIKYTSHFFAGVQGIGSWARLSNTDTTTESLNKNAQSIKNAHSKSNKFVFGMGASLGYLHRMNRWMMGVEGFFNMFLGNISQSFKNPKLGEEPKSFEKTVKPRYGFGANLLIGPVLDHVHFIYGLVGVEWRNMKYATKITNSFNATSNGTEEKSITPFGFSLGLGYQYLITQNLSIGVQFKATFFQPKTMTINVNNTQTPPQKAYTHEMKEKLTSYDTSIKLTWHF